MIGADLQSEAHALYRFHDADGRLLYVGITLNPANRWRDHKRDKDWWHEVDTITIEKFESRGAALLAERQAIISERPAYNIVHGRPADSRWGTRAEDMPDDCHDHCVKAGILSIYYPYRWARGQAFYVCDRGHRWTCSWGHSEEGRAPEYAGHPVERMRIDDRNAQQRDWLMLHGLWVDPEVK